MPRLILSALVFLVIGLLCAPKASAAVIDLNGKSGAVYAAPNVEMLEDAAGSLTVDGAASARDFVPFGRFTNTHAAYWLRITYRASHPLEPWYVFLGYKADVADLYVPSGPHTYTR